MRRLSLEGKIIVFKSLAISKAFFTPRLTSINLFTTRMAYLKVQLKNVDVFFKITSLQCSWLKQLFDNQFHQGKVIPLFFINKNFVEQFKFHSNLDFSDYTVKWLNVSLHFTKVCFLIGKNMFLCKTMCPPFCILNQFL